MNGATAQDKLVSPQVTDALAEACAETGLSIEGARLLHLHSNTVFYLPGSDAVARINSGLDGANRVAASLRATGWLVHQGFPAVRPKVDRAVVLGGIVISFWEYEQTIQTERSLTTLARLLRELHAFQAVDVQLLSVPSPVLGTMRAIDDHPEAFDGDDGAWLAAESQACDGRWSTMRFVMPAGLIHGDAHPNNLLYTRRGVLLGDWDHVGYGPPEWDLVQALYFHRRFPVATDDLDAAARVYGWDLRTWPEADDLIWIREISGLGSYIRTAAVKPATRAELAYRIRTLREHDITAVWHSPRAS